VFSLPTGEYYITVEDSLGCPYVSTATLFAISPLEIALLGPPTDLRCYDIAEGAQTVLAAAGAPGYHFRADDGEWSGMLPPPPPPLCTIEIKKKE
jgi:hypothetical protein